MQPEIIIASHDKRRRPPIVSAEQPVCQVCAVQFSRYTCPHCNLHYCSLPCFRSEAHAGCSESFDRKSLLGDIQAAKDKTGEEKRAMVEMLRKFEEESLRAEEGGEQGEAGDEERRELEERLDGLDLDKLSPDDLLALLSPSQREAFDSTLRDPGRVSALVAEEFESDQPWWELAKEVPAGEGEEGEEGEEEEEAVVPELVEEGLLPPLKVGEDGKVVANPLLVYNVVAVLFAYAYVLRTFSLTSFSSLPAGSTERTTAIGMFSQLVPFLLEKTTLVFGEVGEAVEYVVSRESPDTINPELLALILSDVGSLLRPAPITAVTSSHPSPLSSHPISLALVALSDLHSLLTPPPSPRSAPSIISRPSRAPPRTATARGAAKLLFYIALLASPGSPVSTEMLADIAGRIVAEVEKRLREAKEAEERIRFRKLEREEMKTVKEEKGVGGARIVEME